MKKKNNFSHLIRAEMVKRFEDVVISELQDAEKFKVVIEEKIQLIFEAIDLMVQGIRKMKDDLMTDNNKLRADFNKFTETTQDEMKVHRKIVTTNAQQSSCDLKALKENSDQFLKKSDYDQKIIQFNSVFEEEKKQRLKDIHDLNIRLAEKEREKENQRHLEREAIQSSIDKLNDYLKKLEEKTDLYYQKSESLLKELRVEKKTVFVLEKHIEYLMNQLKKDKS